MDFTADNLVPDGCSVTQYEWSVDGTVIGSDENLTCTFGDDVRLTYSLTLDNGCTAEKTVDVPVKAEYATPKYVSCVSPSYGALVTGGSVGFLWNPDSDILYYELITADNRDFANADTLVCGANSAARCSTSSSGILVSQLTACNMSENGDLSVVWCL